MIAISACDTVTGSVLHKRGLVVSVFVYRYNCRKMAHVVKRVQVTGFTEYLRAVEEYKNSSLHLFALFTGTPNSDGNSWCGDCVKGLFISAVYYIILHYIYRVSQNECPDFYKLTFSTK